MATDVKGEQVAISIPVAAHVVLDRVNKALAPDRQRIFRDGDRYVWIDFRAAKAIDLEEYARRHGHMDHTEKFVDT
jgi:hypothetical protein